MSSFEWMELQTLTADISNSRSRLAKARAAKDNRLVRLLEEEITAAESRRVRLLAHITNDLAADRAAPPATTPEAAEAAQPPASLEEAVAPDSAKGEPTVWDQLTPADLERAKSELEARRNDMLARHAEELKALDADQSQLDALDEAIAAFVSKFNPGAQKADVVALDDERGLRLQGRG